MKSVKKTRAKAKRPSEPAARSSINVPKTAELIAETLRRRIVQGELTEGDALPAEAALMKEFGVSRASLREALRILEAESLLEVRRGAGGGPRIRLPRDETVARFVGMLLQLRGATLREMFNARLIIEPPLINQLAKIRTADDVHALRRHVEAERAILGDFKAFGYAAAEFHRLLIRRSGNVVMSLIVGMLDELYLLHLKRFIARARADQLALNTSSFAIHKQIVDMIEARDGDAAEVTWRYHMQQARKIILHELGEETPLSLY
ncbi:MAG: GntR family transcriptional regulator [Rhizomicrobium sp.]